MFRTDPGLQEIHTTKKLTKQILENVERKLQSTLESRHFLLMIRINTVKMAIWSRLICSFIAIHIKIQAVLFPD